MTLRSVERRSTFHGELHDFGEQIERMVMMVLLVCFGSIVAEGSVLQQVDWRVAAVAVATLAIVRPLAGWISLTSCGHPSGGRKADSVGVRHTGTGIDLLSRLRFRKGKVPGAETIWAIVLVIILTSIVFHGVAVTPVMRWIDNRRGVDSMKPKATPDVAA